MITKQEWLWEWKQRRREQAHLDPDNLLCALIGEVQQDAMDHPDKSRDICADFRDTFRHAALVSHIRELERQVKHQEERQDAMQRMFSGLLQRFDKLDTEVTVLELNQKRNP